MKRITVLVKASASKRWCFADAHAVSLSDVPLTSSEVAAGTTRSAKDVKASVLRLLLVYLRTSKPQTTHQAKCNVTPKRETRRVARQSIQ